MATVEQKIEDNSWLRQAFLVPTTSSEDIDNRNRSFSPARFSFGDTSLGGSLAINAPAQFTPNCDIRVPGIMIPRDPKTNAPVDGMKHGSYGRYYYEAINENSRIISMRFGVPQFNSLTTFFSGFYNSDAGVLARTGRGNSTLYNIGLAAGYVIPLFSLPLLIISLGGNIMRFLLNRPSSKYYYLKPTMPLYWNAVTTLVNSIAVNKGIVPRAFDNDTKGYLDDRYAFKKEDLDRFSTLMPDILSGGQINVYAMATKYQRLARKMYRYMEEAYDRSAQFNNLPDVLDDLLKKGSNFNKLGDKSPSFQVYLSKWFDSAPSQPKASGTTTTATGAAAKPATPASSTPSQASGTASTASNPANPDASPAPDTESTPTKPSELSKFQEFLNAELDDGSSFVSFRVDNEGAVSESFSSSVQESEIASKINSMSGQARNTTFNFAGGNIGGGIIGNLAGSVVTGVKDLLAGAAAGVGMSGLAALGGSAFVDIPKHWQSSTASLPRMSYTFSLTSPYGNKLSQMFNIYVPLSMILAAALPLSTGKQSYTSPFLVELYDRGRAQTRLGIIDSLSITRGTGNLGFNRAGSAMAIDVSFTVIDLSSVMHMPIIQGFSPLNPSAGLFDDDTVFTDYMAVLGSLTLNEQTYTGDRLRLRLTKTMSGIKTWFSAAHTAQWIGDLAPAQLISAFYAGRVNR